MKKLLLACSLFLAVSAATFAQTKPASKAAVATKTTTKTTATASTAHPLKADGTADMRYKANKESKTVVTGPVKKDGTLDKRYKANKVKKN